jgi:essential nuclear protein 1
MPRASKLSGKSRHDPLHVQLGEDEVNEKYGHVSQPGKRKKSRGSSDHENENEGVSNVYCLYFFFFYYNKR